MKEEVVIYLKDLMNKKEKEWETLDKIKRKTDEQWKEYFKAYKLWESLIDVLANAGDL